MARIKGIVMENNNSQVVILTPQGEFQRIKINKPIEVGEFYYGPSISPWKYILVAVVILALTMGTIDFFTVRAYAQVSSSLELGVNRWDRVVTARALDHKGEEILQQSNFTGKKVDKVVEVIVDKTLEDESLEIENPEQNLPLSATVKDIKNEAYKQNVVQDMNKGRQKALEKRNSNANNDKAAKKGQGNGTNKKE